MRLVPGTVSAITFFKTLYLADFEVYDERATDPQKTILDIYVGINH
ncbi:MAG: hypothetical protein NT164_09000 [Verrucomicrobiae bacterium]|nr:hypothetical protein [Verrucomicrobiae bacterium]